MVRFRGRRLLTPFLLLSLLFTIQVIHRHGPINETSSYGEFIGESFQKLVQFSDNENVIDPEEILMGTEDSVFPVIEEEKVTKVDKNGETFWPRSLYKTVLIYNPPPFLVWKEGNRPFRQSRCEEYRCFFTTKHSLVKDMRFDAILFSPEKKMKYLPVFGNRRSNQTFIYFNLIPPTYASSFKNWKNFFNLTMTYKNDSDIYFPLGKVVPKPSAPKSDIYRDNLIRHSGRSVVNLASGKSKLLATASGCKNNYLSELEKLMPVDNFGDCGLRTFKLMYDANYTEFFQTVSKMYKFFLIPEVFSCNHYVHLLIFEVLKHDLVPVIYGSNVQDILPVHSYIDARDKTPENLIELLKKTDENDVAYNEYFWWKNHFYVKSFAESTTDAFCDLCRSIHSKEKKTVNDMKSWWFGNEKCKRI